MCKNKKKHRNLLALWRRRKTAADLAPTAIKTRLRKFRYTIEEELVKSIRCIKWQSAINPESNNQNNHIVRICVCIFLFSSCIAVLSSTNVNKYVILFVCKQKKIFRKKCEKKTANGFIEINFLVFEFHLFRYFCTHFDTMKRKYEKNAAKIKNISLNL